MQSLASLMSLKPSDIGNLDDFNDSDEEDKRTSTGTVRCTGRDLPSTEIASLYIYIKAITEWSIGFSLRLIHMSIHTHWECSCAVKYIYSKETFTL